MIVGWHSAILVPARMMTRVCGMSDNIDEQLTDKDFIRTRTNGFDKLKRHTDALDLKEISEQTSVPLEHMRKAAVKFAKETSGMLFTARGIEQQTDGTYRQSAVRSPAL